ncbi:MAG: hypothetical protein K0R63_230 [Rickettsiales bacterium]|jgi:hypothetical protein|nr:hypothetical protein [Rickettsiales bacterium]
MSKYSDHQFLSREEQKAMDLAMARSLADQEEDEALKAALNLSLQEQGKQEKSDRKVASQSGRNLRFLAEKVCEYKTAFDKRHDWDNVVAQKENFFKWLYSLPEAKTLDVVASNYITQWFSQKREEGCTEFLINIGSNGSEEQCHPTFTRNRDKVAILNIDPNFKQDAFIQSPSSNVVKVPFSFNQENFSQGYCAIVYGMFNMRNEGQVTLINCMSAISYQSVTDLAGHAYRQFPEGKFTYIQAYHDFQPAAILNQAFFEATPEEQLNIKKAWDKSPTYEKTQEELDAIVEANKLGRFGTFYSQLKDIPSNAVFPEKRQERQPEQWSSMVASKPASSSKDASPHR